MTLNDDVDRVGVFCGILDQVILVIVDAGDDNLVFIEMNLSVKFAVLCDTHITTPF